MRAAEVVPKLALANVAGGADRYEITWWACCLAFPLIIPVQLLEEDALLRVSLVLVHLEHGSRLVALRYDYLVLSGSLALAGRFPLLERFAADFCVRRLALLLTILPALVISLALDEELLSFLYPPLYPVVVLSLPLIGRLAAIQVLALYD